MAVSLLLHGGESWINKNKIVSMGIATLILTYFRYFEKKNESTLVRSPMLCPCEFPPPH
jgi:hypothetical protein